MSNYLYYLLTEEATKKYNDTMIIVDEVLEVRTQKFKEYGITHWRQTNGGGEIVGVKFEDERKPQNWCYYDKSKLGPEWVRPSYNKRKKPDEISTFIKENIYVHPSDQIVKEYKLPVLCIIDGCRWGSSIILEVNDLRIAKIPKSSKRNINLEDSDSLHSKCLAKEIKEWEFMKLKEESNV